MRKRRKEKCYYHKMKEDSSGQVSCALMNENLAGDGFGFYIKYRKEQLPQFIEWKMVGEGTYVMGMEPANCLVEGRDKERERGTLRFLEPGEKNVRVRDGKNCVRGDRNKRS